MSMSTHVVGFRLADARWKQMKAIWDTCEQANVPIPAEVNKFFDGEYPGDKPGAEVTIGPAIKFWSDNCYQGYEVDLTKLPKDVTVLRFYNS